MGITRSGGVHPEPSRRQISMLGLIMLLLAACDGNGGGDAEAPQPPAAPSPPSSVVTLTPFVTIGPIRHDYAMWDSAITVNGRPADFEELQFGGEIGVIQGARRYKDGQLDSWYISTVDVRHLVIGPVESIDTDPARLTMMGQTVIVIGGTVVSDVPVSAGGLEDVQPGDALAVSGFLTASGELVATRIDRRTSGREVLLRGLVAASDPAVSRFRVGGLDVYYGQADIDLQDFPNGAPAVGDQVLLRANAAPTDALLDASAVALVPRTLGAEMNADVELTGAITRFGSSTDFDVAGVTVSLDCAGAGCGVDPELLRANALVRVYGKSDANGGVRAGSIVLLAYGDVLLTGPAI